MKNKATIIGFIITIVISIIAYESYQSYLIYNEANKIEWQDIGHVTYILPLFLNQWHYRYDISTNFHGNIILRENGLPQPNIILNPHNVFSIGGNGCAYTSLNPLKINTTIGLIYHPACGYEVIPQ